MKRFTGKRTIFLVLGLALAVVLATVAIVLFMTNHSSSDVINLGKAQNFHEQAGGFEKLPATKNYHITLDGLEREFIVYRPAKLKTSEAAPLVFMYHGGGGTGEKFYQMSGWRQEADKQGIMVVFPTAARYYVYSEAPSEANPNPVAMHETRWSSYHLEKNFHPDYPDQKPANDVEFTRSMVEFIEDHYAINTNKIYANGFSSGGFLVNRLMAEASDIFAAFGSSSSGMQEGDLDSALENAPDSYTPRPTAVMVGSVDSRSTKDLGVRSFPTDESALADDSVVRTRYVNDYLTMLGLNDTYDYTKQGKLTTFTFATEAGRPKAPPVPFQFMITAGMDHVFPNGKNYPVVAADVYWEFFKGYTLSK